MPSSSSTTSTVVGGLCGSGLGMALTYVPSTTRASRAIFALPWRLPLPPASPPSEASPWGTGPTSSGRPDAPVLGPDGGMRAASAVRGRATGTRELDALNPRHLVDRIDAILLTIGRAESVGRAT